MKSYEKVQRWLYENGITQRELAEQVGMTEVAMSRFLRGERLPHAPYMANIASVMKCDLWDLIKDDYPEAKRMSEEVRKPDKITLKDALEVPVWKMVWVGEPTRQVDVRMTYQDLKEICDLIEQANHPQVLGI